MNNINSNFIYLDVKSDILYTLVKINYNPNTFEANINNFESLKEYYNINMFDMDPSFDEEAFNKLKNYNFINEIHSSLETCFNINEEFTKYTLSNQTYNNFILLSSKSYNQDSKMLSFITVIYNTPQNTKFNEYNQLSSTGIFYNRGDNNISRPIPFNYIYNVCKNPVYNDTPGICKLIIQLVTDNNCNDGPFILDVLRDNEAAINCYKSKGFVDLNSWPDTFRHPEPNKHYMLFTNDDIIYKETNLNSEDKNIPFLSNKKHYYTLIAHGLTLNSPDNVRQGNYKQEEFHFPFDDIQFYASEGQVLYQPNSCGTEFHINLPTSVCYKRMEYVNDNTYNIDNDKLTLTPMQFSVNEESDNDEMKKTLGLYYCNGEEKIVDWDWLQQQSFTDFIQLFDLISNHAEEHKIKKENIIINLFVCRGYCEKDYTPLHQPEFIIGNINEFKMDVVKGGSNLTPVKSMNQMELITWLDTCKKPMKGGTDTIFDREIHNGELRDFNLTNETIENRNNIDNIQFINGAFIECNISNCGFDNCKFEDINFLANTKLNSIYFNDCTFKNVSFQEDCMLQNINFKNCTVHRDELNPGLTIYNSTVDFSDFRNMDLTFCIFNNSKILSSDFRGTNLTDSIFENADLTGIIFNETTILKNTKFINITGLDNDQSDVSTASFDEATLIPSFNNNSPRNVNEYPDDDELSEVSTIGTDIIYDNDANNLSIDENSDWLDTFETSDVDGLPPQPLTLEDLLTDEDLLKREPVKIKQYSYQTFDKLTNFDVIQYEDVNYCDYIKKNSNHLIFLYDEQTCFITKTLLKQYIKTNIDPTKIVFLCKEEQEAFVPQKQNIYEDPQLNMDIFGLFGVMIPLQELDFILNNEYQIYIIQANYYNKPVPIASLSTRLGGNVVGANHCQSLVAIKSGYITYIENETFKNICNKKGGKKQTKCKIKTKKNKSKKSKK